MPLVIAEDEDFTIVVNACFFVDSDFLVELLVVDSLVTLVFVFAFAPLELATSFFDTVIVTKFCLTTVT